MPPSIRIKVQVSRDARINTGKINNSQGEKGDHQKAIVVSSTR